jgi:hypothetical protein
MHINTIIIFLMVAIPMAIVFYNAYQWAQREDRDTRTIRTTATQVGFDENGYFPRTHITVYPSIGDPQPFNWDSTLHMMLPNEITTYIQEDM